MILEQKVKINWNSKNRKLYESKNYVFTKWNDEFEIELKDLAKNSHAEVKVQCDYCGKTFRKQYCYYNNEIEKANNRKITCINCASKKRKDNYYDKSSNISKLDLYKNLIEGKIKCFPDYYFDNITEDDIVKIFKYFVDLLIQMHIINNINEFPKVFNQKLMKKFKLTTFCINYSMYDIINMVYPNRWYEWEFLSVKDGYWDDENNLNKAYNWLLNKLTEDKIIYNKKDIINIDKSVFKQYRLEGLLNIKFNSSPYLFWNYFNPNVWFEWEFKNTPKNFWSSKNNRINAIKQLCNLRLSLKINEIPDSISYPFLVKYYHKFSLICDQYYKSNLYQWINECYPNIFKPEDFNSNVASDGTKLDSKDEKIIHEFLISFFDNVKYYDSHYNPEYKWYNKISNEKYIADWLLNNKYIIEYFGWYNICSYGKNEIITNYIDKAIRKINYFSNLADYYFIPIFPADLKNSLCGLKEKLNIINN